MSISSSSQRNTFQATKYLERKAEEGKTPDNDEDVLAMVDFYKSAKQQKFEREQDPEWQKNNMEYDLRTTQWILDKVRSSEVYAQNLYAALCNNEFMKLETIPILMEQTWSCSWRYAGGIIADMRQEGDYIDWYCSGIRNENDSSGFVGECVVTDEIREDLLKLGWKTIESSET